jgi:hypothetical protein
MHQKQPCPQCPYRRKSLAGYLGESSGDPEEFLFGYMQGEQKHHCHMKVDWESEYLDAELETAPVCVGFAIFNKNQCRLPVNRDNRLMVDQVEMDNVNVFEWTQEFIDYHKRTK